MNRDRRKHRHPCVVRLAPGVRQLSAIWQQSMVIEFLEVVMRIGIFAKFSNTSPLLLAPPSAKIVPGSRSTLPSLGGLSSSDDHLPVCCSVAQGADTGSRSTSNGLSCPMTGQDGLTVPRDNIFVGSVLKYPFRHIQGPRPSTFVLLSVPSEGLQLLPFPKRRGRRSKKLPLFNEAGSRPVGEALAHEWLRAHNVFGPHLSQLAVLLSPPSFSLRL